MQNALTIGSITLPFLPNGRARFSFFNFIRNLQFNADPHDATPNIARNSNTVDHKATGCSTNVSIRHLARTPGITVMPNVICQVSAHCCIKLVICEILSI